MSAQIPEVTITHFDLNMHGNYANGRSDITGTIYVDQTYDSDMFYRLLGYCQMGTTINLRLIISSDVTIIVVGSILRFNEWRIDEDAEQQFDFQAMRIQEVKS